MNYYLSALKKYAVFSGRARRSEYWFFVLINVLIATALSLFDPFVFGTGEDATKVLSSVYGLAVLLPSLAVLVRRLHDTNRSGWWILIGVVPLVGAIVLFILACFDSTPGDNRFGPNPKTGTTTIAPAPAPEAPLQPNL
jgi:uncharacterized membrane protein YhaH (DUF805 family)